MITLATRGRRHEAALGNRIGHRIDDARLLEHVGGARGARARLRMREGFGFHQHELRQRHVLHGTGDGADIARVRGLDEHDAQIDDSERRHGGGE